MSPPRLADSLFLSLDGLDGSGKSTQCRLLAEWLGTQGYAVTTCVDPGGTPLGQALRDLLLHHRQDMASVSEAFLFMASRAQLVSSVIRPALARGHAVISDRFLLANVVYQGYGAGLDPEQLWQVGRFATGGLEPDLTLVLDLPLATALTRRHSQADRIESRDQAFHERVRQGFLTEAKRRPDWLRVIDAGAAVEIVHQAIRAEVEQWLSQRR
jgi:dTMP kinase